MRNGHLASSFWLLASLAAGCGPRAYVKSTHVHADQAALGRVVVYRNGIAYYERRAVLKDDRLVLRVPADKVDDFLKSLTVADARTGQPVPVSFPSKSAAQAGDVDMTIQVPGGAGRELVLTYVTDAPAWKPSYRVVVDARGKVSLQGWAIVDNTSGEDWRAVRVGVGSSSALSFRYDLHSIRVVPRETLHSQDTFAKAPPTGGSIYRSDPAQPSLLAELADGEIPRQQGYPGAAAREERATRKSAAHLYGRGAAAKAPTAAADVATAAAGGVSGNLDDSRVRALAQSIRGRRGPVVLQGWAAPGEAPDEALNRANLLRNQLILNGVAPAQLQVQSGGVGQKAAVRLIEQPRQEPGKDALVEKKPEDGSPVGESHFESRSAMTVPRGQSAMVSIVSGDAEGQIVYLYDSESPAGDARYAFRAVRFKNPTASTLESGPMTVYGNGRFIGEGLSEAIPAHAAAVVPFALDRQVVIERDQSSGDRISRLIKLQRGVLTTEVQHTRRTQLKITNRQATAATVLLRHTVREGWHIEKGPKLAEQYGAARLFQLDLKGGETQSLTIEEATPMTRTVDLRSQSGVDLVTAYLDAPGRDAEFAQRLGQLVKLSGEVGRHQEEIESLRQRGDEYRVRMDELHAQIVSLQAVKAGGALLTHLQAKMREISQRVQANTIALVDLKEKEMVAKVALQEGLSELTLAPPADQKADPKAGLARK